jgi:hypothetical protein
MAKRRAKNKATPKAGKRKQVVSLDMLMQAKTLARRLGGIDKARAALDTLARLLV